MTSVSVLIYVFTEPMFVICTYLYNPIIRRQPLFASHNKTTWTFSTENSPNLLHIQGLHHLQEHPFLLNSTLQNGISLVDLPKLEEMTDSMVSIHVREAASLRSVLLFVYAVKLNCLSRALRR